MVGEGRRDGGLASGVGAATEVSTSYLCDLFGYLLLVEGSLLGQGSVNLTLEPLDLSENVVRQEGRGVIFFVDPE